MRIAIVGASGAVGLEIVKILQERKDAGDERILLRVWRPEYRVSSLVALSFNKEKSD